MHIKVPRKELLGLVKTTTVIAKNGEIRPVLRNILLEASNSELSISSTDLSVSLWLKSPVTTDRANTLKAGKVLVPALRLMNVLKTSTVDTVELELIGRRFKITAGRAIFNLVTESVTDFPKIPRFSPLGDYATISVDYLTRLLKRTAYCAHTERSHYNMHGALLKTDGLTLEIAATNGQRLAVGSVPLVSTSVKNFKKTSIIPASSVWAIKHIASSGTQIDVQWLGRGINFRGDKGEAMLLALNGKFPPYQKGVPKNKLSVSLNRKELIDVLKQANAVATAVTGFVDLTLNKNVMSVNATVQGSGIADITHDIAWTHPSMTFVINPDFLIKAAVSMQSEVVCLEVANANRPTLLREQGDDDLKSCCVFAVARR